jgi:transposase
MVEENYTNKKTQDISGACASAISRWKRQYLAELSGHTPQDANAITVNQDW